MSGPNAAYSEPRERDDLPLVPPGGAGGLNASSPLPRGVTSGWVLSVGGIRDKVAELRPLLAEIEATSAELDAAMLERRFGIMASAAARLQSLAGNLVKALTARERSAA